MPDEEEKRLRKLAQEADDAEEARYNALRIKQLQGKAAPAKKKAVTLESVEKAFEKKTAPHAERKDYQVSKEPAGHRTPQERQEIPTWNWGKSLLGKERRLAREVYDTAKEDYLLSFPEDRDIYETKNEEYFTKEEAARPWRTTDGNVNLVRSLYEKKVYGERPKPGDEEYYFGEGENYMEFLEELVSTGKRFLEYKLESIKQKK